MADGTWGKLSEDNLENPRKSGKCGREESNLHVPKDTGT